MLWGSAMLAKLADAGMCVRHECRVLCRFWVVIITQLLMPVGSTAATCFSTPSCDDFHRVAKSVVHVVVHVVGL